MESRVLLASCAVCAAGLMALGIVRRPRRSDLDALLLAILGALALWCCSAGMWSGMIDPTARYAVVLVACICSFTAVPLWLVFTLRAAHPRALASWPLLPALILAPAPLAFVAVVTNSVHHGILKPGVTGAESFREMAGPLLLLFTGYTILCLVTAALVLVGWAWRLRDSTDVHRATLAALGLAAAAPIATSLARVVGAAPPVPALIPAAIIVSILLLAAGPLRDRLLEGVPITHRDVFDALRDGVLVANTRGVIVDANVAAERLLARARVSLLGVDLADAIAELAAASRSSALRHELEELASTATPLRLDVTLRDGRRLEVRAACVGGDTSPEPTGRYALLRDRTEERRFAEVARRAQKLETVATLAGGVAHEVSNPLAYVRADLNEIQRLGEAVEAHRKQGPSPLADELSDLRGLAEEALEGIARIERIAAGMRRLATAGEGFSSVDLLPVVDEAVQLARIRFARPLAVELDLDPELPAVRGSPALLVQALVHLLIAAQRTPSPRSAIRVRGERANGCVLLHIGSGAKGELAAASTRGASEGEDLGLPIARDIARDHGGELEVVGSPASPSVLTLRLPLAEGA